MESVASGAPGTPQKTPESAPSGSTVPGTVSQEPDKKYVSSEDFRAGLEALKNSFFAELRRAKDTESKPASKPNAEKALDERVAELERERAAVRQERCVVAIERHAKDAGVPGDAVEFLTEHLTRKYKLDYDADRREVVYRDEFEQPKPVGELISSFLKTPKGQMFLPAPGVGGVPRGGSKPQGKQYLEMTLEDRLKMTPAQEAQLARGA